MIDMKYVNMDDVYDEVNDVDVLLEVDGDDLIVRIPYMPGSARELKEFLENIER